MQILNWRWESLHIDHRCVRGDDVKNNEKSKKYIIRGQRNVRYHDRILSNKKKSYNLT